MSAKRYRVIAPYVTMTTATPQGTRLVGFFKGAPVPLDVPQEQIGYHLRDNLIEEVPAAEAPAPEPVKEPEKPKDPEPKNDTGPKQEAPVKSVTAPATRPASRSTGSK